MKNRIVVTLPDGSSQDFDGDEVSADRDDHTGVLKVRNGLTELGVFQPAEFSEYKSVPA